jgi:cytochrome b561
MANLGRAADPHGAAGVEVYSPAARRFHWWTVALIVAQVPLGIAMAYRGNVLNVWDGLTNTLYSSHKTIGLVILLTVVLRLSYRLSHGAPADEPTIEPWQKLVSHATHWAIYVLLLVVPVLGWLGVSYYPALDLFGIVKLPGLVASNQDTAAVVFYWHATAAFVLIALIGMHFGAAMFHHLIRKDNVLARMLPGLLRRR